MVLASQAGIGAVALLVAQPLKLKSTPATLP